MYKITYICVFVYRHTPAYEFKYVASALVGVRTHTHTDTHWRKKNRLVQILMQQTHHTS